MMLHRAGRSWTRALGNYSPAPRAVRNIGQPTALAPKPTLHSQRDLVMSRKSPRNPNPNIALINRRQALGALCAFGTIGAVKQFSGRVITSARAASAAASCTLSPSLTEGPY
jgi:hypothetical protein